jgi:drug/metabolite transporter (DMT)-like permease
MNRHSKKSIAGITLVLAGIVLIGNGILDVAEATHGD